jgi:hypothetical protein
LAVTVVFEPRDAGGAGGSGGGDAAGPSSSSGRAAGAGQAGDQAAAATGSSGSSGTARQGADAGAGAGGGPNSASRRPARQPMALYRVLLRSPQLEEVVLGGRTRMALARQGHQVYVEQLLSEAERAQRRELGPEASRLRAEGVKVRWKGAVLEKQVRSRGGGRPRWEQVQLAPRGPTDRSGGAHRARAEGGAEAGAGAGAGRR